MAGPFRAATGKNTVLSESDRDGLSVLRTRTCTDLVPSPPAPARPLREERNRRLGFPPPSLFFSTNSSLMQPESRNGPDNRPDKKIVTGEMNLVQIHDCSAICKILPPESGPARRRQSQYFQVTSMNSAKSRFTSLTLINFGTW